MCINWQANTKGEYEFSDEIRIFELIDEVAKIKTPHEQTPKDDPFSPLYICSCGVISHFNLRVGCRETYGRAYGKFQSHADSLRPRNTPLLSISAPNL